MSRKIIIGSRGSDLALWQANHVQARLKDLGAESEIKIIKTQGDQIQNLSFDKLEGKGFFTKEIEQELLDKSIDLAVHSHKDLETDQPKGLTVAAVSEREDPSDILLIKKTSVDASLKYKVKKDAVVGTSSARRKSQLIGFRPDFNIKDLRGNVPTRIQKLRDQDYDAIMLARAGVERLNIDLSDFEVVILDPREFIPAPAQGVLALQTREDDASLIDLLKGFNQQEVADVINVERKILNQLEGGCQLPLGVYCEKKSTNYNLWVSLAVDSKLFPNRRLIVGDKSEVIIKKALKDLKTNIIKDKSVFISREVVEDGTFYRSLNEAGCSVSGAQLINIESIPFSSVPQSDWIFFSSKNTVVQFYKQVQEKNIEIDNRVKIGVIGRGTENALRNIGIKADFIGQSRDTVKVAENFNKVLSEDKSSIVLFPQSNQSLRAIQQKLDFTVKAIDLLVYNTSDKQVENIPNVDYYVFTSPSNVKSFLHQKPEVNRKEQKVVAIGPTTFSYLKDNGFTNVLTAEYPSEIAMSDTIISDCYND